MKKILLPFYLAVLILIGTISFMSCSKEDEGNIRSISKKARIAVDNTNKKVRLLENTESITSREEIHTIENDFYLDPETMPAFNTEQNLATYVTKNVTTTDGHFELKIDEELLYSCDILNGQKINEKFYSSDSEYYKIYPCSYKGIRACAVDTIHAYNWYDMWGCVSAGFACVVNAYGSCFASNC